MYKISQTQLANYVSLAGVIVLIANKFGLILDQNEVAYVLVAVVTTGTIGYNYIQRFKKGDLTLGGIRK